MRGQDNFGPSHYPSLTCVENDGSPEFRETPGNRAFRSISCMQSGPNSGSPNPESGMAGGKCHIGAEWDGQKWLLESGCPPGAGGRVARNSGEWPVVCEASRRALTVLETRRNEANCLGC